jgi:hypothetical protein
MHQLRKRAHTLHEMECDKLTVTATDKTRTRLWIQSKFLVHLFTDITAIIYYFLLFIRVWFTSVRTLTVHKQHNRTNPSISICVNLPSVSPHF